jgi:hypothetical protein
VVWSFLHRSSYDNNKTYCFFKIGCHIMRYFAQFLEFEGAK